jgi:penicillin amidase
MRRVLIALAVLVGLIVVVSAGTIGGLIAWVKFQPPATTGNLVLPGLAAPVDLVWDRNAIPNIFAGSYRDAYRVMGWVHARDRLWQMETQRRIGQGRLSELVGSLGLPFDREMRVLGIYRLSEAAYAAMDPETKADLDAYAAGVNAYLAHPAAPLPIEFQLLGATPEPWRPADSLVFGALMALQLSGNYRGEALKAELIDKLAPDVFKDLFPDTPPAAPTTLSALSGIDWTRFAQNLPPVLGPNHASNLWAVDGTLSKSGKPMIANDPHLGLSAPIVWYLARIVTPQGSLSGGTFPGVPFTVIGHNDRLAWGTTTTGGDAQDLFVEDVVPGDDTKYRTPDGQAAFVTRDEVIKVRFGADVHLKVRESRHGPVISDIDPELAHAVGPGKAVALSFVGLLPGNTTVQAIRDMGRAYDWPSFQAALKLWRSPEQNIVYGDVDGHIAFVSVGPMPLRKRPTDDLPAPGSTGEADWTGLADYSQLPQSLDPPSHRFINANNRVVPPDYPLYISRDYGDSPYRAERITDLLDAGSTYTLDYFRNMQLDIKEQDADLLLPRLLAAEPKTDPGKTALAMLKAWDRTMPVDRPEPLIYSAWVVQLQHALLEERLGAYARAVTFGYSPSLVMRLLDRFSGRSGGADQTPTILATTLDQTVSLLSKAYGSDITKWRWGDTHHANLTSQLFGGIPLLGALFDIPLEAPGGAETLDRAGFYGGDGVHFPDMHGPGYRGLFDLSDLDGSRFIIATGESGNPLSPHFGDFAERWRAGQSVTLSGTIDAVAATGLGRQRFSP